MSPIAAGRGLDCFLLRSVTTMRTDERVTFKYAFIISNVSPLTNYDCRFALFLTSTLPGRGIAKQLISLGPQCEGLPSHTKILRILLPGLRLSEARHRTSTFRVQTAW